MGCGPNSIAICSAVNIGPVQEGCDSCLSESWKRSVACIMCGLHCAACRAFVLEPVTNSKPDGVLVGHSTRCTRCEQHQVFVAEGIGLLVQHRTSGASME